MYVLYFHCVKLLYYAVECACGKTVKHHGLGKRDN